MNYEQPRSMDAEKALLGSIFLDNSVLDDVLPIVPDSRAFYATRHRLIFDAMLSLNGQGKEIDWILVKEELEKHDDLEQAGGVDYLRQITEATPTSLGASQYAEVVRDKSLMRDFSKAGSLIRDMAYDSTASPDDVLSRLEDALSHMYRDIGPQMANPRNVASDVKTQLTRALEKQEIAGLPSGHWKFDEMSLGWHQGALNIVAANTGEGKTFWAWHRAQAFIAANPAFSAGIVSGEMEAHEIVARQIVGDANLFKASKGSLGDVAVHRIVERIDAYAEAPVHIVAPKSMSLSNVVQSIRQLVRKGHCKLIFIDYLQLIRSTLTDSNDAAFEICSVLKETAMRLGVQLVLLAQFTKEGRKKPPLHSDESDVFGGSAVNFGCHCISIMVRPARHTGLERLCYGLKRAGINPDHVTLERVVKNRRGAFEVYMLGYMTEDLKTRPMTAEEHEIVKREIRGGS